MKQVLQSLKTGSTEVADVPTPGTAPGQLLIRSRLSLVSAGTERMLVEFGKAGLIDKARQQPDKVRMVLDKVRTDGLMPTLEAVRNKLDQPMPMGYCNVGTVVGIGAGVTGFVLGDRVASNGRHAEVVSVPANLCAKVPEPVTDESAVFTVLASIGLQGLRLAQPTLGECVVVTGLGLIGLVTVQLLKANGCRVLGLDFDPAKLALARDFGAETVDLGVVSDPVAAALAFSRGRGVDAVLITAATRSNDPVRQAAQMSRKRGRIVLVGVAGLELSRADFYEKELTFQVSCSYGPGRYDPTYEQDGVDYPVGFVRWTEQRNFEAALDLLSEGRLDVARLVSHRFGIDRAEDAYAVVGGAETSLGIVLEYPSDPRVKEQTMARTVALRTTEASPVADLSGISVIGAGNYAGAVLIPALKEAAARFRYIAGSGGVGCTHLGRKFGFAHATTDTALALKDPQTSAVVVATRHDSHARYVIAALEAGKHVFVEKPLCLTRDELTAVAAAAREHPQLQVMVGFNRRFAPHVRKIKQLLAAVPGPRSYVMTVNAGAVPSSHWMQDPEVGGGRLLGEGCHFMDLLRHLAGVRVDSVGIRAMRGERPDTAVISIGFVDGSIGVIHYFANGSKSFPKERLEVFAAGGVLQLDNFRHLRAFGWPGFRSMSLWRQDKGQRACAAAFMDSVRSGGPAPIPLDELLEIAEWGIRVQESAS